jgi:hypothetical protein|tara:strand:- start:292 stop:489 length:198 start_codon:yes stop_codon:yes gene_type:complete
MKPGDLVKLNKLNSMGVIVEVFAELDEGNPWVRVLFTHPKETYQWCRANGLTVLQKEKDISEVKK